MDNNTLILVRKLFLFDTVTWLGFFWIVKSENFISSLILCSKVLSCCEVQFVILDDEMSVKIWEGNYHHLIRRENGERAFEI